MSMCLVWAHTPVSLDDMDFTVLEAGASLPLPNGWQPGYNNAFGWVDLVSYCDSWVTVEQDGRQPYRVHADTLQCFIGDRHALDVMPCWGVRRVEAEVLS